MRGNVPRGLLLQCGRIYKDAEIYERYDLNVRFASLQCGRIYKDAEIRGISYGKEKIRPRFNVAASIKMRKFSDVAHVVVFEALGFNVAASIKMRKCERQSRSFIRS